MNDDMVKRAVKILLPSVRQLIRFDAALAGDLDTDDGLAHRITMMMQFIILGRFYNRCFPEVAEREAIIEECTKVLVRDFEAMKAKAERNH